MRIVKPQSQLRALLVEQSPYTRNIILSMLRQCGLTNIVSVANGFDALQQIANQTVDLLMIDYDDRKMSGDELALYLRKNSGMERCPIIFTTFSPYQSMVMKVARLGDAQVLKKPFSQKDLKIRLERASRRGVTRSIEANIVLDDAMFMVG